MLWGDRWRITAATWAPAVPLHVCSRITPLSWTAYPLLLPHLYLPPSLPFLLPPPSARSYTFILGLLLPAYSFTGYDGPAHMSEESTNASMAAPWGILLGVVFMIFVVRAAGWVNVGVPDASAACAGL